MDSVLSIPPLSATWPRPGMCHQPGAAAGDAMRAQRNVPLPQHPAAGQEQHPSTPRRVWAGGVSWTHPQGNGRREVAHAPSESELWGCG